MAYAKQWLGRIYQQINEGEMATTIGVLPTPVWIIGLIIIIFAGAYAIRSKRAKECSEHPNDPVCNTQISGLDETKNISDTSDFTYGKGSEKRK